MLDQFPQPPAPRGVDTRPLIFDSFAGCGGASTGIEMALGRSPDVAIDHSEAALSMHAVNHPETIHVQTDIHDVDPRDYVGAGQEVGLAWFSPDCTHHSKARGGKPASKKIRSLAWVVVKHAKLVKPKVIFLENVEEFQDWGPLDSDNRPCKARKGQTFVEWVIALESLGYKVDWRELRACDYGAPTIRERLFVIARCDGEPITWPEPTHGAPDDPRVTSGELKPYRAAADIIDWSIPCPSIFDTSEEIKEKFGVRANRPLADNTMKRIARGLKKYVLDAKKPFFVSYAQHGGRSRDPDEPMHTLTASKKDQNCIVTPTLVSVNHGDSGGRREYPIEAPLNTMTNKLGTALVAPHLMTMRNAGKPSTAGNEPTHTITAGGAHMMAVSAFLAQHNGGPNNNGLTGRAADRPVSTLTTRGTQQQVVAANLMSMHGSDGRDADIEGPHQTICAGGNHSALISSFLTKYYGTDQSPEMGEPMHTLTTKDRFNLVTVEIDDETYAITDIGMRMLTPREQFRAQGFPDSYIIDRGVDGRKLNKSEQTHMCGNSVSPQVAKALVGANCAHLMEMEEKT